MKKILAVPLAVFGFAACGGGMDEYSDAAPTYDALAMDMSDADVQAAGASSMGAYSAQSAALAADPCHPHLFLRTRAIVYRVNHHIFKALGRIGRALELRPKKSGANRAWEKAVDGLDVKYSMTKTGDGTFTFKLEAKPQGAADSDFVTVFSGDVARTDGQPHHGKGTITYDFDALKSVKKDEQASGKIVVAFEIDGDKKILSVQTQDFIPEDNAVKHGPQNATYVFQRIKGVGGSMKFKDELVLLCPPQPNLAQPQVATVETVARWVHTATGGKGRADAMAIGGQIPADQRFMGVTCFDANSPDSSAEKYWQMKLESNATGSYQLVSGSAKSDTANGPSTCDPAFGPVPALDSAASDFDFGAVDFGSTVPYPVPGA